MANFRKREGKNGKISWQVTVEGVRDPVTGERKRYSKTVHGTKKQAMVVARQLEDAILGGNLIAPAPIKLSKWMDDWLTNYLPNIAQTTRDGYEEKIKNYIVPNLGHIPINALTPNHIQSWVNKLQQSGLSPKTIRNAYNNLNAALKKAVVLRMIPHNPCEGVELPKLQRYEAKIYDTTDIQKALDAAKGTSILPFGWGAFVFLGCKWGTFPYESLFRCLLVYAHAFLYTGVAGPLVWFQNNELCVDQCIKK